MLSFDSNPTAFYWILNSMLVGCGFILLIALLRKPAWAIPKFYYSILMFSILLLIGYRLPIIAYNAELNPDESWMLVGAMTLEEYPIFYEYVNGDTSGPLNFYSLSYFIQLFKQSFSYTSARIFGITLWVITFLSLFFSFKKIYNINTAILTCFFGCVWVGNFQLYDFTHLSSEHLPICLLSIFLLLTSRLISKERSIYYFFFVGIFISYIPLSKLQVVPPLFILGLAFLWLLFKYQKQPFRKATFLILGATIGLISYALIMFSFGVLDDFFNYYILFNLHYQSSGNILLDGSILALYLENPGKEMLLLFFGTAILFTIASILNYSEKKYQIYVVLGALLAFSSLYAVLKPGLAFQHYLLFLVIPILFMLAHFIATISHYKLISEGFGVLVIAVAIGMGFNYRATTAFITEESKSYMAPDSPMAAQILKYTTKDKKDPMMFVLGAGGKHFLATKTPQGVPWSHTVFGVYKESVRNSLLMKIADRGRITQPAVFIDTHRSDGKNILDRSTNGYEKTPYIKELIDENYTFITEIDSERLFARNDLVDVK